MGGTYAGNEFAIIDPVTKKATSPSLHGQGNTILIREWHDPARTAAKAPIPYNPIEEYPCNGAPAGDYCSVVVHATPALVSVSVSRVSQVLHVRRLLIFSK